VYPPATLKEVSLDPEENS